MTSSAFDIYINLFGRTFLPVSVNVFEEGHGHVDTSTGHSGYKDRVGDVGQRRPRNLCLNPPHAVSRLEVVHGVFAFRNKIFSAFLLRIQTDKND